MNQIVLQATKTTPAVDFNPQGNLMIEGVSLPEDSLKFYQPLFDYVKNIESSKVVLDMKVEYLNTSSTKQVYILFKLLAENRRIKETLINWHYSEDDEDMLDSGQYYKSLLPALKFRFIEFAEFI